MSLINCNKEYHCGNMLKSRTWRTFCWTVITLHVAQAFIWETFWLFENTGAICGHRIREYSPCFSLHSHHRLPTHFQIHFNMLELTCQSLNGLAPSYISFKKNKKKHWLHRAPHLNQSVKFSSFSRSTKVLEHLPHLYLTVPLTACLYNDLLKLCFLRKM